MAISTALINRAKRYLEDDHCRIILNDLVVEETKRALARLSDAKYSTCAKEELPSRLNEYESAISDLQIIIILLAHWADREHWPILQKLIARVTDFDSGKSHGFDLSWYPAIILLYSGGISAIAAGNYENLAALLTAQTHYDTRHTTKGLAEREVVLSIASAMLQLDQAKTFNLLPNRGGQYTPRSDYLFKLLQPDLDDLLFLGPSYEATFDRFEMLLALVYADISTRRDQSSEFWGPQGRFACKYRPARGQPGVYTDLQEEAKSQGNMWPPLRAGLFNGSLERFQEVASGLSSLVLDTLPWH